MKMPRLLLLLAAALTSSILRGQFVAFNDQDGRSGEIHPFTTTYSFGYDGGQFPNVVQGRLRNITDGEFLDAEVRVEFIGPSSYTYYTNGNSFAPDTPAALVFGCSGDGACFADFRDSSARVYGGRTVVHTFLGLNPARTYQLIGTGIGLALSNDTTRYTITGAVSFVNAHTTNCIFGTVNFYTVSNAVIVPTGRNHLPGFGDMAIWNDIRVGSNGSFTVVSSGEYGVGSPINGFRLKEDFVEPTPPLLVKQPANLNAARGSQQNLAPKVQGSLPLSFQWFKDGTALPTGTNRVLRFTSLQPDEAGSYWLVATNPYGAITTTNVTVTVSNDPIGIVIQPQDRSLRYGDLLSLSVTVTGTPPYFIQWFQNGFLLPNATNSSFVIAAVNVHQTGTYSVSVSNLFSSALSSTAVVTVVEDPLRVIEEPSSQTVTQGTTLRVQVAIAGSAPLFQWFRNGAALANATGSVYRVTSATTNHTGSYHVVATGPMNAVTSSVATITVVPPAPPPPPPPGLFSLLTLTNLWAYNQSGDDLGTAWREINYPDASWSTGRGVLAIDNNTLVNSLTNTVLRLMNDSGQPIITSYFRTHFFWPTGSIGAVLLFSNLIDDGAIFYLNGVPLFRYNMPAGLVASSTLALAANPGGEGVFVITNLAASSIMEGDNVLAVELHQNSPTSSDNVFGTAVWGYNLPDVPLAIVASPTNQTVLEGQPLELNFVLNAPARFQWYRDGVPISAPHGASFSVGSAIPSDAGQYIAVATNSLGAVTSAVAAVQVIVDTLPPRVTGAVLQTNRATILIDFDEPLHAPAATNIANYRVLLSDNTDAASVMSVNYSNRQVVLSVSPALPQETNLVLWLNGIWDRAAAGNQLNDFRMTLRQLVPLVPVEGIWKFNDSGDDLGTSWREPAYNDSTWPEGAALLYNDNNWRTLPDDFPPPVASTNTFLQITNGGIPVLTHYFRTRVNLAASPLGAQFSLRTVIDDGALLFLNGSEFFRIGMPDGPISATDMASRVRGTAAEGSFEGPFVMSLTNVAPGENVLAAEVHQGNQANNADISFGIEVTALAKSFPNEAVHIVRQPADVVVREGQPCTFDVDSIAALNVQWHHDGTPVPGANGELLTVARAALSDNGTLFQVALSNAFSFAVSRRAMMSVIVDTNPPVLLAAAAGQSLTEIVLSFSEPIDAASASDLAQYTVRNSAGQLIALTGVTVVDETNVVLTTVPRVAGRNYEVRVEGIRDTAAASNEIEPGSGAMLGYEQVLVPLTATWAYDQSGNGQVEAWKSIGFDDRDWPRGQALFYNDTFTTAVPAVSLGTLLSVTNAAGARVVTHYFRHEFNLPPIEEGAVLSLRHAVDDGVVIYLNGAPIERRNVPAGTIDATTLATFSVGDAVLTAPNPVAFVGSSGNAVIAGEIHQFSAFSSDVAFAAELSVVRPSSALTSVGPTLRISREGPQLRLSWSGGNYLLESATSVDGIWNPIQGAASPLLIQTPDAARFYRLRSP